MIKQEEKRPTEPKQKASEFIKWEKSVQYAEIIHPDRDIIHNVQRSGADRRHVNETRCSC